ncbi:alpha/beta hydrolase [Nocardia otitidiscaviarum]|uniref:alpha/beta hydrolase n=1 Tax=Nocardia otitidiscaviarum TaxID=1823 RepID=UPI001893425F|nr:alpha/beta hydrolase [Nocardia otitidiscaviarum]MBF6181631.1 alpha/beta hydrolase [Nocardia otitidiscaviarum]
MNLRRLVLTAMFAAACAVATAATPVAHAEPDRVPETVDIACGDAVRHLNADWYLPDGPAGGLIWLQHGFARSNANVASLAEHFAAAGYVVFAPSLPFMDPAGCTLQNLGDNTGFLGNIADLFATDAEPTNSLARSFAAATATAHRPDLRLPRQTVFVGHSAGGEAVEYVARRLHTDHPAAFADLRGLVLLDPVKSFLGDNTDQALTDLDHTDLPILDIAAKPSPCNLYGVGTDTLQRLLHRRYLGIRIGTGVHTDAEGPSGDTLGNLVCGDPTSVNISTLQTLAVGWATDYFTGTRTAAYYPAHAPAADAAAAHSAVTDAVSAAPEAEILTGA